MVNQFAPTFVHEEDARRNGFSSVAGVDEAGRGALAGPVVAAAVIAPPAAHAVGVWAAVRDSKLLTPATRAHLVDRICEAAVAWAVAAVDAHAIDHHGIAAATRRAMCEAVQALQPPADFLLIDWVRLPLLPIAQKSFAKADRDSVSVAAASILAKVHRDRLMTTLHAHYPAYHFAANKGYGSPAHLAALAAVGPCPEHRRSFSPVADQPTLFDPT